jgi:Fe-S cluster biogenesis protein NfuA
MEPSGTNGRSDGVRDEQSGDALVERLGELLSRLENVRDPLARNIAQELLSTLMEVYGEGLDRIFDALDDPETPARSVRDHLLDDGVVSSLLLMHGLFPVDLQTRVRDALDKLRPQVVAEGGMLDLVEVADGVVRLRLTEPESGCNGGSSLEPLVSEALEQAAPDMLGLELLSASEARKARSAHTPLPVKSRG